MSRFLNAKYAGLHPYVPGEQPKDRDYIKLNANEISLPPSPKVKEALSKGVIDGLGKYSDPHAKTLCEAIGEYYKINPANIFIGNGSDEILSFCFTTFFAENSKVCFPDITYDFYKDYALTFGVDFLEMPIRDDFTIDIDGYIKTDRHIIIANPNALTGLFLSLPDVEKIIVSNPNRLVIIDEAYVDYDNESSVPFAVKYPNVVVIQTFSKSRNLAGARIGFAVASKDIIDDLNDIKFTFNPMNISSMAIAAGVAAVGDTAYLKECVGMIIRNREHAKKAFEQLGFSVVASRANFFLLTRPGLDPKEYCARLKDMGILVRRYDSPRIENYTRITIGTAREMDAVINATKMILKEKDARVAWTPAFAL
jgi:histidinol-phosphate aminotransferase